MRSCAVALIVLSLAACAERTGVREHIPEFHTVMIVSGSDENLAAFEVAARRCGVEVLSRVPNKNGGSWVRVQGPVSTDEVLVRYDCAKAWVTSHPAELQFVGDEAGDLWD